jgi:SnoaL-like domain
MAFIGSIEDKQAISELYAMYSDASTRGNPQEWLSCWVENGRWSTHLFDRVGKPELLDQWEQLWANFDKLAFIGQVTAIEVEGDHASARSIAREIILLKGGGIYKLVGAYEDRLIRQNGAWFFVVREYRPIAEEV